MSAAKPTFEEFFERVTGEKPPKWVMGFYEAAKQGRWVVSPGFATGRKRFGQVVEQYERLFGVKRVGLSTPPPPKRSATIILDDPIERRP